MPTFLTHPAVPLALGLGLGRSAVSGRLLACGLVGAILPDLDVIAFRLGIPYAAAFGHRGFSHSLLFAVVAALLAACACKPLRTTPGRAFTFVGLTVASHGLLDTLTNGGLGIGLFWPWSETRYFAPVQPIEVSPLNPARFFSPRGVAVLLSELMWVWFPLAALVLPAFGARRASRRARGRQPLAESGETA